MTLCWVESDFGVINSSAPLEPFSREGCSLHASGCHGGYEGRHKMENNNFGSMALDELWSLHEQVTATLVRKIAAEKAKLEDRLRRLATPVNAISPHRPRRPYPKVLPKYQNPKNPAEKWSGRGKQPR